jgi:hypothetical protein
LIAGFNHLYPLANGYKRFAREGEWTPFAAVKLQPPEVFANRFSIPIIFGPRMKGDEH